MSKKVLVGLGIFFCFSSVNVLSLPSSVWAAALGWFPKLSFLLSWQVVNELHVPVTYDGAKRYTLFSTLHTDSHKVTAVAFSPDSKILVAGDSGGSVVVWSVDEIRGRWMHETTLLGESSSVTCIAVSSDGQTIATATEDKMVRLWIRDSTSCNWTQHVLGGHTGRVNSIAFSPKEPLFITAASDGTIKFWEFKGATKFLEFKTSVKKWRCCQDRCIDFSPFAADAPTMHAARFSADGEHIAIPSHFGDKVDIFTTQCMHASKMSPTIKLGAQCVVDAAFSPCGTRVVVGRGSVIEVWALNSKKEWLCIKTFYGSAKTRHVMFAPHGQAVVSLYENGNVRIWSLETGRCMQEFQNATSMAISPDGNWLAIGLSTGDLQLYSLQSTTLDA